MTGHRRPTTRRLRWALVLAFAAIAAFYRGAVINSPWPIIGALMLAGVAAALTLDTPEDP